MHSTRADPNDPVGGGDSVPAYRVRVWGPPPEPRFAWSVDEWDVTDAEQVTDVIDWAADLAGDNPFEVFVRWEDHHTDKNGRLVPRYRYALLYGGPAGEEQTTKDIGLELL